MAKSRANRKARETPILRWELYVTKAEKAAVQKFLKLNRELVARMAA